MGIQANVDEEGCHLLGINPASDSELMDRTSAAMNEKIERFFGPLHLVGDIVEGAGSENSGHCILDVLPAEIVCRPDLDSAHQVAGFLLSDTGNLDLRHKDRACAQVYGLLVPQHLLPRPSQGQYAVKLVRHRLGCLQTASDDDIYALVIEAHHIVFMEVRLHSDVRDAYILLIRFPAEHVHSLADYVLEIVEAAVCAVSG